MTGFICLFPGHTCVVCEWGGSAECGYSDALFSTLDIWDESHRLYSIHVASTWTCEMSRCGLIRLLMVFLRPIWSSRAVNILQGIHHSRYVPYRQPAARWMLKCDPHFSALSSIAGNRDSCVDFVIAHLA